MTENDKLSDLRKMAREKFSDQEIDDFINMGKKIASKPIICALLEVIKMGPSMGKSQEECDKLCKKLSQLQPYDYCGFVSIGFKETSHMLNICLSLVPKDYATDIDIPSRDYINDLFEKYDFLKEVAVAYWHQFMGDHPELIKRIISYRDDVGFDKLMIDDKSKTTMYWDPNCPRRIGIFAYYVDSAGRPFYKRGK